MEDDEALIPLKDVPNLSWLPPRRNGAKLHPRTLRRWVEGGAKGPRLEIVRVGEQPCTTKASLLRFFEQRAQPLLVVNVTPSDARRAQRRAKSILDRAGI